MIQGRVIRKHWQTQATIPWDVRHCTVQAVFRSVVVAKLMYASSAWFRVASKTDQQRIDAYLRRGKKCGICPTELPTFQEQVTLWHSDYLTKFNEMIIISHHLRHHLRTTISGQDTTQPENLEKVHSMSKCSCFWKKIIPVSSIFIFSPNFLLL